MEEAKAGRGKLRSNLNTQADEFEVDYYIVFNTELRLIRSGFPPVAKTTAKVERLSAVDRRPIPEGEYILTDAHGEMHRLSRLSGWHYLAMP